MGNELEKLRRLNEFMEERLNWFAGSSFNADEANRVHEQALIDLDELKKEIDRELIEQTEEWED